MSEKLKRLKCDYPDMVCVANKRGPEERECWNGDNALQYAMDEAKRRRMDVYVSYNCPVWDSELDKPLKGGYVLKYKRSTWKAYV